MIEVGADGEKVDVMTFRGEFEQDMRKFAEQDGDMKTAVADEDDDAVETLMNERFYHRPRMHYSPDKLIRSYGVPATTPAFVYNAVGKKPLPTKEEIVGIRSTQSRRGSTSAITNRNGSTRPRNSSQTIRGHWNVSCPEI